jgi:hypothetical protein
MGRSFLIGSACVSMKIIRQSTGMQEYKACNCYEKGDSPKPKYDHSMIPIYQYLAGRLRNIVVYNGDTDPSVQMRGTANAVRAMGKAVVKGVCIGSRRGDGGRYDSYCGRLFALVECSYSRPSTSRHAPRSHGRAGRYRNQNQNYISK